MHPGSTATFCTEELMNKLNLNRKRKFFQQLERKILFADFDVCGREGCNFIELQEVFSQKTIPANKGNILEQVKIPPYINIEIKLLVGTSVPKALEQEEVNNWPFAVRTVLRLITSRPLGGKICEPAGTPSTPSQSFASSNALRWRQQGSFSVTSVLCKFCVDDRLSSVSSEEETLLLKNWIYSLLT